MKDAYYFPHDSNARYDEKCAYIISKHGMTGYGLYWLFIEAMHQQADGKLTCKLLDGLAFTFSTDITMLREFYNDAIEVELFVSDGVKYWSNRVLRNKQILDDKRSKKSEAGKLGMAARWQNKGNDNTTITNDNNVITENNKVKESKEKDNIKKSNKIDFETYKKEVVEAFNKTYVDQEWIKRQQKYNPGVHIQLSLEQSVVNFWGTEAGWVNKKKEHTEMKDWRTTFAKTLKFNKVYLTAEQKAKL